MKISIIVPIGNLDEWQRCETSINASLVAYQGPVEVEVLPCYDLEHKGAYLARNEGLKRATGEWIAWVDCDDLVERAWFGTIADEVAKDDCDILVFGIIQEKNGKERKIYSPKAHIEDGDTYGHWMLCGLGMPHWLWHRVFRRELFDGVQFAGRVKQDYQASLQFLPRVKRVRFIPDRLYRYIRHGHGLSNYVQVMDYDNACQGFLKLVGKLPQHWQADARMGVGLLLTDVILHAKNVKGLNKYLRPHFWRVLLARGITWRFRVKALVTALMIWK